MRRLAGLLIFVLPAFAQTWDVACPVGTTPHGVSVLANEHLKAYSCVDSSGQVSVTSAITLPTSGGGIPSGLIAISLTSCPTGFTEVTALDGKMLRGTLEANGDAGTTGGNATITPAGSVSTPTFTGAPLGTHQHTYSDIVSHTHPVSVTDPGHTHLTQRYPTATGGSSGFTIDTSMSGTLADNTLPTKAAATGITATSSNPAGSVATGTTAAVSAGTPAGTNSQPTFTGEAIDPSPPFTKVIFCSKD